MTKAEYAAKLLLPQWQVRRLQILEAASFTCQECGRSGCKLQVHHVRYEHGRDPWDYPDDALICLCNRCHQKKHEELPPQHFLREMICNFAASKSMPKRSPPTCKPRFDNDRIHRWLKTRVHSGTPQRECIKFAHWLWKTGTKEHSVIEAVIAEALRLNPDSWYGYYAPGGTTRTCRHDQHSIANAELENQAHKAADRAFLEGK